MIRRKNVKETPVKEEERPPVWTFFTNHTHVLVYLAIHGDAPLRDVAAAIGITERAVQRIIKDLVESKVLSCEKVGRNNHYRLHLDAPLRHNLEQHCTIGQVVSVIIKDTTRKKQK